MEKPKNLFNKQGGFVCGGNGSQGCGKDAGIARLIRGYAYCAKCYKGIKGEQDDRNSR